MRYNIRPDRQSVIQATGPLLPARTYTGNHRGTVRPKYARDNAHRRNFVFNLELTLLSRDAAARDDYALHMTHLLLFHLYIIIL